MEAKQEKNKLTQSSKNILIAFVLNLSFSIIEVFVGIFTNSISILSDSLHDFGDCLAVGTSYFLEKLSLKKPNDTYTYGYVRYSVISALITTLILIVGAIFIFIGAINRLIQPEKVNSLGIIIMAVLGVVINGIAAYKTSRSVHLNEKAINLHMMEDVLGWIVVLIGGIAIEIWEIYILDPILSILIGVFILYNAIKNLILVIEVFLEKTPKNFDMNAFRKEILEIENVNNIHHEHIWTLDGESLLATIHIGIDSHLEYEKERILKEQIKQVAEKFLIKHITIELDRDEGHLCHCEVQKIHQESVKRAEEHSHSKSKKKDNWTYVHALKIKKVKLLFHFLFILKGLFYCF